MFPKTPKEEVNHEGETVSDSSEPGDGGGNYNNANSQEETKRSLRRLASLRFQAHPTRKLTHCTGE